MSSISKLYTTVDRKAEEAVHDIEAPFIKGLAKAMGWGGLQGVMEGFVVVGVISFVYSSGKLIAKAIQK